jgi:uncharacterized protein (TIGR02757 family)
VQKNLKDFLDRKAEEYNRPAFIETDPVCIPHAFKKKQDIEISGFFASIFAWGNRTTIINKSRELMQLMDNAPHEFCLNLNNAGRKRLSAFKHRTFNDTDLLYFVELLHHHYKKNKSLESAFSRWMAANDPDTGAALTGFHHYFFSLPHVPGRTKKHIASPEKNSTCKRLNMFLRWMVRTDRKGVDFGIWKSISPSQLVCPVDVHVARVARHFKLIERKQVDWLTAIELTNELKKLDPQDPVKYDFALFGLGVMEKFA